MSKFSKRLGFAVLFASVALPAFAADLVEPVPEAEPAPVVEQTAYNGWYIRGDAAYRWSELRGINYITYGAGCCALPGTKDFDFGKLKGALSLGGGVGYQVTNHFRVDLTGDYFFKSKFRGQTSDTTMVSVDTSSYSAFLLLANAYADLGTYNGFTPYVGAGIGGANVKWDNLRNTISVPPIDNLHKGASSWRFAYSLMAGASYCLTDKLALDGGYRFTHVNGGRMFEETSPAGVSLGAGPGFDRGFNMHEVRAGLRYSFGGSSNCAAPQTASYEPAPVYKQ